jgi:two-component system, NtrC family, sensor histidine kinase KinB
VTLRRKLLLSQLPLVVALAVIASVALYAAVRFGSAPGEILYENFRSFDAGRSMLHTADAIDQRVLSASLQGEILSPQDVSERVASFERELRLQETNITEEGEKEATGELQRAWSAYRAGLEGVATPEELAAYRERSRELRSAVDSIVEMNRDAMGQKSERAREEAARIGAALTATAVIACLLAILISVAWIRRILAPVRVLERAVQRLSEGDFDARIRIEGSDEISSLSASFNEMAARLARYRQSSIGELLDSNNRLESVMDSLADAVVVYDLDGEPVANNEVATRLLGLDLGLDALPETLHDAVRDAFDRVRQSGEPHEPASLDAAVETPGSPSPRWVLVSATPVRTRGGVLSGVTVALRDVTRSRRVEDFKGDLVAAAAHELRTPLTSLHMAVHLCLEHAAGPLTDRQQDLLATARQDCERLQLVVEELLEMAHLESGAARLARSQVNVGELVRDATSRHEAQARQHGKGLDVISGDSLISVDADFSRLQRVLDNLLENAFLHAGDGGRVAIGFERDNGSVRIFVDDTGPGIPPDLRERVFTKFFRVPGTTKRGSGLGLSIVEDIVRAHGGEVGVNASPLGGARFWFSIPLKPEDPRRQDDESGSSAPSS